MCRVRCLPRTPHGKSSVKLNVDGGCVEGLGASTGVVIRGMDEKAL